MAEHVRDDFKDVMLTMDGRKARLPQADRAAIEEISRTREEEKKQLAQEQARTRQADIAAERTKLTGERVGPAPRPPSLGPTESYQQFSARIEKQAERNVDFNNSQDIAKIEDQKQKDIEKHITESEERQEKRARDLEKAAQMAREFDRASRENDQSR